MALEKKLIPILLDRKLNTDVDFKVGVGMLKLHNVVFDRQGRARKRRGYKTRNSLSQTRSFLSSLDGKAVTLHPGVEIESSTGAMRDVDATYNNRIYDCSTNNLDVTSNVGIPYQDFATYTYTSGSTTSDIACVTYLTFDDAAGSATAYLDCFDVSTGTLISTLALYTASTADRSLPRLVQLSVSSVLVITVTTAGISLRTISGSTAAASSATTLTSANYQALNSTTSIDVARVRVSGVNNVYVTYKNAANNYVLVELPGGSVSGASNVTRSPVSDDFINGTVCGEFADPTVNNTHVWWLTTEDNGSGTYTAKWESRTCGSLSTVAAGPTTQTVATLDYPSSITMIGTGLGWSSNTLGKLLVTCHYNTGNYAVPVFPRPRVKQWTIDTSGTFAAAPNLVNVQLASKMFLGMRGMSTYVPHVFVYHESWNTEVADGQRAYFLTDLTQVSSAGYPCLARPLFGRAKMDSAFGDIITNQIWPFATYLTHVEPYSPFNQITAATRWRTSLPALVRAQASAQYTTMGGGYHYYSSANLKNSFSQNLIDFTCAPATAPNMDDTNEALFIGGASPRVFDGNNIYENGFVTFPGEIGLGAAVVLGGSEAGVTYSYTAIYESVDRQGKVIRSAPSVHSIDVTGGDDTPGVNLVFYPCQCTSRSKPTLAIYRTTANGQIFYRVGAIDLTNTTVGADGGITYTDEATDTIVETFEALYTDGDELPNFAPFPYRVSCIWNGRFFYADREHESTTIYYSKTFSPGNAVGFNPILQIELEPFGGVITALVPAIDKLVIFKESRIYATEGSGLTNIGAGTNFIRPYAISQGIGCTNRKSVVAIDEGIMFLSNTGIWLLNKSMQLEPVGEPVRYHTENEIIYSTAKHDDLHLVMFFTSARILCYDWLRQSWSTFDTSFIDSVTVSGRPFMLSGTSLYSIKDETDTAPYADFTSTYITPRIDFGWMNLNNIMGYSRSYRVIVLGQKFAAGDINIRTAYDHDETWEEVDQSRLYVNALNNISDSDYYNMSGSLVNAGDRDKSTIVEFSPSRQKNTSIRIELSISQNASTVDSAGTAITGLLFVVGVKPTDVKLGSARRF